MNRPNYPSEFEELTLLAILKLKGDAYGSTIRDVLEEALSKRVNIGALYTTLDRLERKGFVRSWMGDPTPERGGRAKRFFEVDSAGKEALKYANNARRSLVSKLEPALKGS